MQKKLLFMVSMLIFACPLLATDTLNIKITHLMAQTGCVNLALYDNATAYKDDNIDQAYLVMKQRVTQSEMTLLVPNLVDGIYAIKAFQDNDCTGRMKQGWFGIPKYAFGFSNNTKSLSFDAAKFMFDKDNNQQIITLKKFSIV